MYKIRRAAEEDHPTLLKIWEEAVESTHEFLAWEDFDFYKYRMPRYFRSVDLFVYENEGKVKGFAGTSQGNLEMLFVSERGSGIGSRLLSYVIAHEDVRSVGVNEQNPNALAFYTSRGFTICGRQKRDGEGLPYPILDMKLKEIKE